jgi:hypothetical protein
MTASATPENYTTLTDVTFRRTDDFYKLWPASDAPATNVYTVQFRRSEVTDNPRPASFGVNCYPVDGPECNGNGNEVVPRMWLGPL